MKIKLSSVLNKSLSAIFSLVIVISAFSPLLTVGAENGSETTANENVSASAQSAYFAIYNNLKDYERPLASIEMKASISCCGISSISTQIRFSVP